MENRICKRTSYAEKLQNNEPNSLKDKTGLQSVYKVFTKFLAG